MLSVLRKLKRLSIVVPERTKEWVALADPAIPILSDFLHSPQCNLQEISFDYLHIAQHDFVQGLKDMEMIEACLCLPGDAAVAPPGSSLQVLHVAKTIPHGHEGIPIDVEDFTRLQKGLVRILKSHSRLQTVQISMKLRKFASRDHSTDHATIEWPLVDYLQAHPDAPFPDILEPHLVHVPDFLVPFWPHSFAVVFEFLKSKRAIASSQLSNAFSVYEDFRLRLESHYSRYQPALEEDIDEDDQEAPIIELSGPPMPKEEKERYLLSLALDVIREHPEKLSTKAITGL
eukprot:CAMPEP_0176079546 /NCGR_PEP_ID=MMETSP0120_2-20121206/39786_1 /TAXON_ID=160619 /ORGANISM="Kryptoperidinium foliaceum, Strain CCMP 1326" /LENGTH=287 /DNA_ID=CAMNT_0017413305 /DNA_START=300 /DNA_END=1163 /DNA_ORIENTATION=+